MTMPKANQGTAMLTAAWDRLLDLVYPPRCGGCDMRGTLFCDKCLASIKPSEGIDDPEHVNIQVSAGVFTGPLRTAIHNFKFQSDTPLAKPLAKLIYGALAQAGILPMLAEQPTVLLAVPLHVSRLKARGYNQSELLARELFKITGWPVERGLVRTRHTNSQVGLASQERLENVSGAFGWTGKEIPSCIVLVDDVCTTGSTLSECARVLKRAGAERVYAAVVGRAVYKRADSGS